MPKHTLAKLRTPSRRKLRSVLTDLQIHDLNDY